MTLAARNPWKKLKTDLKIGVSKMYISAAPNRWRQKSPGQAHTNCFRSDAKRGSREQPGTASTQQSCTCADGACIIIPHRVSEGQRLGRLRDGIEDRDYNLRRANPDDAEVREVSIPDESRGIWSGCFCESGLVTITLPRALEWLGNYAFENCKALGTVSAEASCRVDVREYVKKQVMVP